MKNMYICNNAVLVLDLIIFHNLIYTNCQTLSSKLSQSYYCEFLYISNDDKCNFYEGETINANWSVELILCTDKGNVDIQYALGGLSNNIFASKYVTYLPDKEQLIAQVEAVLSFNDNKEELI